MPRGTSASASAAAVVLALLALAAGAASQAPTPAAGPSADCGSAVTGLVGCLDYITPGNPQSKPPTACCAGVKTALKSPATVSCLCNAFGQDYGIPINFTRAAGLPAACGGDPAAFSKCHLKVPGAAPTEAPSSSSGSTPVSGSPTPAKNAATGSPVSATIVLAAIAAPLLSYYYL